MSDLTSLAGTWQAQLSDGTCHAMRLPGTLDENGIGGKDTGSRQWHPAEGLGEAGTAFDPDAVIATRFTRKHTYEGPARLTKRIRIPKTEGTRLFLEAERARCLSLYADGRLIPDFVPPSLSTPRCFELTGLSEGEHTLTLVSDNSYPGLPYEDIVNSSAATDETQTNWNGILGYLRLRREEETFLSDVRVYPAGESLTVKAEISALKEQECVLTLRSEALDGEVTRAISVHPGITEITVSDLPTAAGIRRWDEGEGNLYTLTASLPGGGERSVRFGIRDFGDDGRGHLSVNGRRVFLLGEANCAEFPEEGHPPMEKERWKEILSLYRSYGVNCLRFHSHCPPEAAFSAADELGLFMQPELSHWNPRDAFESEESYAYYRTELLQILKSLANHPSFVMLTLGNELWAREKGRQRMRRLLEAAGEADPTRLYASASNGFYGMLGADPYSDFYTSQKFAGLDLRGTHAAAKKGEGLQGHINRQYPNACTAYDAAMEMARKTFTKPVFSFEVGQFEVLPDFNELSLFQGVSDPANLRLIRERAKRAGLLAEWDRYVNATGELALIGYREETEAALRTGELSGISLLGLQDFPGQGTALVGMLNSHLRPKPFPFAGPERFAAFFSGRLPLVGLPRYTYTAGETLTAPVRVANYGKEDICAGLRYELRRRAADGSGEVLFAGELERKGFPAGALTEAGTLRLSLAGFDAPARLDLFVEAGGAKNSYPVWVYPDAVPVRPEGVHETAHFDEEAREVLRKGGIVYLTPPSTAEALPHSIQAQFTTDFWSVGTFPAQEGGMGQLIDEKHPLFKNFPTEFHTNWQWWPMASRRAVILSEHKKSIVEEMDSYAYMRPMTQLLECRCGGGRLLFSSFGLQDLLEYPEARALLAAVYRYLDSEDFAPGQELSEELIAGLVR